MLNPRHTLFLFALLYLALPSGAREAAQPEPIRKSGTIATGTEWETAWFSVDSGVPGPVVLITGGIHGNEPAGAHAASQIRHWPIRKGKLVVVPFVNKKALAAKTRRTPELPEEVGDLNRCFPKSGEPDKAKTELSSALWSFAKELKPNWVLDLHEGYAIHRQNSKSVGSSILCYADEETGPMYGRALKAVNDSLADPESHFVLLGKSKTANGSLARASMERLGAKAAILETTYKEYPLAVRVRQHRLMVNSLLQDIGMVDVGPDHFFSTPGDDDRIRVAIFVDSGVGGAGPPSLKRLMGQDLSRYANRIIGAEEIRKGALEQFDLVVFPGGSGGKQAGALKIDGREKVREFVRDGGGYIGICAGCYLACENFTWSLKILDAKTLSSKWRRGKKTLTLDFASQSLDMLGLDENTAKVMYSNGPVMAPAGSPDIPDFQTWATFVDEIAENDTPKGIQIGSPAILAGEFGKGRVLGISPHPEQTKGLDKIMLPLIEWTADKPAQSDPAKPERKLAPAGQ